MLWPSSAKPAFLIRTWRKIDDFAIPAAPSEFTVGGYGLLLCMAETEDRAHLESSIGISLRQAGKKLLICTPEDFMSPHGEVHCCTIDWRRTKPESTDWPLVSAGFAGRWRVGVASGCWGCVGACGARRGGVFGLLTLGLCGGVSSGWCRLAGGSGKGSQGFECGCGIVLPRASGRGIAGWVCLSGSPARRGGRRVGCVGSGWWRAVRRRGARSSGRCCGRALRRRAMRSWRRSGLRGRGRARSLL